MLVKPYRMLLSSIVVFILFRTGYINSIVMPPGRFAGFISACMDTFIFKFRLKGQSHFPLETVVTCICLNTINVKYGQIFPGVTLRNGL